MTPDRDEQPNGDTAPTLEEITDPDIQRRFLEARDLEWAQVRAAFRHGFDSRDRFAERTFDEVSAELRESWNGMGPPAPWGDVSDLVRSGYDYAGGTGASAELSAAEALTHFARRTIGGSTKGGTIGDQSELGAAEPVSEEGGGT